MTVIFVYGTLKRGDCRAHLLAREQYLGPARTEPRYRLVHCGEYPGLIDVPTDGRSIIGELYAVSAECLARLDLEEGVADGLYARRPVRLGNPHPQRLAEAYFYLLPVDGMSDLGEEWPVRKPM
jgi:gamma-glutamylaminecyclotransferase